MKGMSITFMKNVYLMQVHKDIDQICRLIKALNDGENLIVIHVDKKNDKLFTELNNLYESDKNIRIIENRVNVIWGGLSQVKATINMIESIVEDGNEYEYISFISGQDYPIKSIENINKILTQNKGKNFIEYKDIGSFKSRIKKYHFFADFQDKKAIPIRVLNKLAKIVQKNNLYRMNLRNMKLYKGSSWFTITYECLCYIYNYINIQNKEYLNEFKFTVCSDEHFFQIILLNSCFKESIVNNNLRYIKWQKGKCNPEILTIKDYDDIKNYDGIFARKFDINQDSEILNKIDDLIL